ncbi:MAG: response regulator [Deltaproteobacteria bacterium]|nr:response regulator [Deltaproteobacteria bacterium]
MTAPIRVLLVEDNPGDAELTRDTLEAGKLVLDIHVVVDGAEAIDFLLQRGQHVGAPTPDLVVLDLNLPKRDGREVLQEIRRHAALRTTPVVILTSSDAEKDIAQGYLLGANCYITKPVDLAAFQQIVRSIETFWFTIVRLP